jgi:hypothetical protein
VYVVTLRQVEQEITEDSTNWSIHPTDFGDDFRHCRDQRMVEGWSRRWSRRWLRSPFEFDDERLDAPPAATAERYGKFSLPVLFHEMPR